MKLKQCLILILFSQVLVNCTTIKKINPIPLPESKQACETMDWWELGRRDGANGRSQDWIEQRVRNCEKELSTQQNSLYLNGYNSGIRDFCTTENGFQIGRTGQIYYYVCPVEYEPSFVKKYRQGWKLYQLETANKNVSREIEELNLKLNSNPRPKGITIDSIKKRIEFLKEAQAKNDLEMTEINNQINQ